MGIFDALGVGYSGLSTSQTGIQTTSHNISNVNTPGYSRQRIEQKANYPLDTASGELGTGVKVEEIVRLHDEFVYGRLKSANASLSYSEFSESTLQEISNGLTDLDNRGIAENLNDFFNSWSKLAQYPQDEAAKLEVLSSMDRLAGDLNTMHERLTKTQDRFNSELTDSVEKINDLAKNIVDLNKQINKIENVPHQHANDLRDQRDRLELDLAKMVNISVYKGDATINGRVMQTDAGNGYNINIAGHNIVDGVTFHPLEISQADQSTPFQAVYYTDHNQVKTDITAKLRGGKVGAILDLRGNGYDLEQGKPVNSKIQGYIDKFDAMAKTLVQRTNSLYGSVAQERIQTDSLEGIKADTPLADVSDLKQGSFDILVYNNSGDVIVKRSITLDDTTTMQDITDTINANQDDNGDNDGTNDLDDLFSAGLNTDGNVLTIMPKSSSSAYRIAIEDNGTNFAGWSGVNKLFEGSSAKDIHVKPALMKTPSLLAASKANVDGSADLATEMVNMQYEKLDFETPDGSKTTQTISEYYRYSATSIAQDANSASIAKDSAELLTKTVTEQMQAVSGVDMDEELMNLMKFQTAYQASAKIITTVDQMLNTLLGMKQ